MYKIKYIEWQIFHTYLSHFNAKITALHEWHCIENIFICSDLNLVSLVPSQHCKALKWSGDHPAVFLLFPCQESHIENWSDGLLSLSSNLA